jgi:autotransporter-associated beta strand protein
MRNALLATTALVASLGVSVVLAATVVENGDELDLSFFYGGGDYIDDTLTLIDGTVTNGRFVASDLYDLRKGTISAVLAGAAALEKSTSDTVVLTGANTYTGLTTINAGILRVDDGGTLGAAGGNLIIANGGTLDLTNTTQTVGTLTMTDNASLIGEAFGIFPLGTLLSSTINVSTGAGTTALIDTNRFTFGTINKNGAGTLRLDAPSNFFSSGVVELNAGVLDLGWQGVLGTGTVNAYDNTTINYFRAGQNHNNAIVLKAGTVEITAEPGVSIVQHGVISDEGNNFGLNITTDTVYALAGANTYTGVTTINGGGQLFLGFGTTTGSVAGDIALTDGSLGLFRTDGALNVTGNITGGGQITSEFTFGSATLSGNNTFSGGIFLFGGTLRAGSSTAFGSGLIGGLSGTTLDLNGFDVSVGGLTGGTGTVDLDGRLLTITGTDGIASGVMLTAGNITIAPGALQRFSGVDLSPVASLVINGAAFISNAGNTAPTSINLASASGVLDIETLSDPSYVAPNIFGAGSIVLGSNLLEAGGSNANATLSGTISGLGGSLKKVGTGILTLSGNNTFNGGIELAQGTLRLASNGAAGLGSITTTGSVIDLAPGVNNAAPIILNSNMTQLQVTGSATQSGVISETGGSRPLEKTGNGVLTMTAANTYTGLTTISAGRIILSGAGEIAGNINIANDSPNDFLQFSKSADYTYSGVISGYNVALTGSGTTTWTGANTHAYTGITGGTLTFDGAGTLGASDMLVAMSGGVLDLNGSTQSIGVLNLFNGGSQVVSNGNLNVSSAIFAEGGLVSANLGGTAALLKFNGGTSVLSGSNTYTGPTTINGGTLVVQGGSAITNTSAVTVASGATLQLDNDETIGSLAGAGNVSLGSNTLTSGGTNAVTTFSGVLSGTGGLTKVGTAEFYLTGANTYTGLTTVVGGRMKLGNGGAIAGDIQIVDNGQAWFDFEQSGSYTYSGVLSGGQVGQSGAGTTTLTGLNSNNYLGIGRGTVTVSGGGTFGASNMSVGISGFGGLGTLDLGGTTQNISLLTMFEGYDNAVVNGTLNTSNFLYAEQGLISANLTGTATLIKNGGGTTTLSGTNSYSGQTTINSGTLVLQGGSAISNSNSVSVAGGATLQLDGDETIGSLAGAGTLALTTKTLITGGNNTSTSWSGTIFGGLTSGLQKTGTGTLSVSGDMNQESTTVAAGELNFNGTATGNIAVNAGARLSGTNTINGNLINLGTLASGNSPGTTTVLGNYTGGGVLDVEVQFNNVGAPVNGTTHDFLNIAGNVLGSPTAINLLTFAPSGSPAATVGNGIQLVRVGGTTSAADFTMSSYLLGSYFYDLAYIANYSGSDDGFFLQSTLAAPGCSVTVGDDACFVDSTTSQVTPIDALAGLDTLQLSGATNFNFNVATIGTVFTNFESYQKADTSTVTLTGVAGLSSLGFDVQNGTLVAGTGQLGATGANNILTPGVLQVASNLTTGSIAGTGSVVLNANLTTGGNNLSTSFSGDISGTGGLTKEGTGTFILGSANSYDGTTNVNAGVLRILNAQALGTTTGGTVVASGAALEIGGAMIIGAEALTLNGSGISNGGALRHITGVVDYTGDITLGSASRINSDSLLGNLNITGAIGGAGQDLTVGGVGNTQFLGNIATGTGSFTKDGTGSVQLFGANTYSGVTTVNAGLLSLAGGSAIADSGQVVVNGGVLTVTTSERIGSLAGSVGTSVQLNAETLTSGGNNLSTAYAGVIFGSGDFEKEGSGTLTLSGANTLTGNMRLNQGGLTIAGAGTLGASTVGLFVQGTLDLGGTAQTVGSLGLSVGSIQNGSLTVNGNAFGQVGNISADLTVTGTFSKAFGGGSLTLSGTNTLSNVGIGSGTLIAANDAALTDTASINMSYIGFGDGPRLQINTNQTIGSIGGDLDSSIDLGSNILTTGGNNASTSVAGIVFGSGGLSKVGTGTFTLTGSNNYTGGTTVSAGTLLLSGSGRAGAAGSNITIADGATLDVEDTSQTVGVVNLTDNARVTSTFGLLSLFDFVQMNVGTGAGATAEISVATIQGGTINKSGAGKLLVSGALNGGFTGTVNLDAGTLQLYWQDALGTGNLNINGPSTLSLNNALGFGNSQVFNNTITLAGAGATIDVNSNFSILNGNIGETGGPWGFTKTGSGMLHLGGTNTFTGGIDLMQGGIRLLNSNAAGTGPITTFGSVISYANAVNSATPIIVNSNTTQLEVLAADSAQQSGAISEIGGPRPIEKIGTGTLLLSGANTYTGATTITAGTLNVTGGSALSNSAAVNIGAAGTLGVLGSESVGSLTGSGILNLGTGSILTTGIDNSSSVFSGSSTGLGGLTKSGTGTMNLTGINSFTGALSVAGGNLTVTPSGALNGMSSFSVLGGASAFLGGSVQGVNGGGMTGTGLGALSVSSGGTMYLDDNTSLSGGTLNLASGSNLNLFLTTNTSQYPQISLSGSANIANANVGVYLDPISFGGTLATSFTYSNVISGSGVTGTFGSVNLLQSPSGLFSVAGIYTPTSAGIQVTRNAFSSLGGGGSNDNNVGDALEDIFTNGPSDPDIVNLITVIGSTPPGSIPAIYAAIAGAENSENTGAGLRTDDPWKQSVGERVNAARTTGCTVAGESWCLRRYAQASTSGGEVMSDVLGDPTAFDWLETGIRDAGSTSVWGRAIGAWGETTGDFNGPGSTQWTGGVIAGVDRVFNSLLLAGVALQYVETSVDFESSDNQSTIRSGQFGAYVSYGGAEAFVNGNLSVIGTQASADRFMTIGLLDYDIHSFARSWALTASVEGGTIMEFDGYRFEPTLAFNYQGAYPMDFQESGGGGLSLIVRPDDSNSLRSILSARVSRVFDIGDRNLVPQLRVDWRHEMLDRRQEFSAAFAGDPTVFFDVDGATYARDVFSAGASLTMPISGRVMGYVDAQGAFSEDSTSAMVSVGGRATW